MIRALIVDDEAPARRKLARLLGGAPGFRVVGEAADGAGAVASIGSLRPDVVFLDVRMPGLDGFGVVREVGAARMPCVVFVTAYDQYALQAFEVEALDYLLKPVSPSRFQQVLERVRGRFEQGEARVLAARLEALLERMGAGTRHLERILVQRDGRGTLVPVSRIDWIEAERNYVRLHVGDAAHVLRKPIGELERRLDPALFLRISRSHIVRLDAIRETQAWFHGDCKLVLRDGTRLTWGRRYRARRQAEFGLG